MTRRLHQELLSHIPDCDACSRDEHDYCTPIVQTTATVCACFTAHPNSEAHDNAIYWWTQQGQWADKPAASFTSCACVSTAPHPEHPMDDGSTCLGIPEQSVFEGDVTIGGFITKPLPNPDKD